jgi:hypothetical protein
MSRMLKMSVGLLVAIPMAAVITTNGGGIALAGAHGGDGQWMYSPAPSTSPSPSASPEDNNGPDEDGDADDQGGRGGDETPGASVSPSEAPSPSETPSALPSASPDSGSGVGLPDTGPAAAMGGMAGVGGISYATYAYLRSKRRINDVLKKK